MADFQQNFLASLHGGMDFGQRIKQQRDTSQLNQLASQAYGAAPEQRDSLLSQMAGVDAGSAFQAEKQMAYSDERRNTNMVNMARMLTAAPEQARPGLYRSMVPTLAKFGLSELPQEYYAQTAPIIDKAAQSIMQALQGAGGDPQQFTLGPGSKRFDASGNVVAEVPFAPANGNLVDVPDGMGGKMQMVWDPRTRQLSPLPQVGAGGGASSPLVDVVLGGAPARVGSDLSPEQMALAQADAESGGNVQSASFPPRDVTPQQFGAPRAGYTPPKERDAPSGYSWNGGSLVPIPGGPADSKANPTAADQAQGEMGMRKELAARLKDDRSVLSMFKNVQGAASDPSAAGDLSMIFAFMKMLDPGSVVREQEFANAQNAAGVPDRVQNMWNRALSGERLNPTQRADFLAQANSLASAAQGRVTAAAREYQGIADQYGYDPARATGLADFRDVTGSSNSGPSQQAARPQSEADFNALPAGALYIDPDDGRTYRKR